MGAPSEIGLRVWPRTALVCGLVLNSIHRRSKDDPLYAFGSRLHLFHRAEIIKNWFYICPTFQLIVFEKWKLLCSVDIQNPINIFMIPQVDLKRTQVGQIPHWSSWIYKTNQNSFPLCEINTRTVGFKWFCTGNCSNCEDYIQAMKKSFHDIFIIIQIRWNFNLLSFKLCWTELKVIIMKCSIQVIRISSHCFLPCDLPSNANITVNTLRPKHNGRHLTDLFKCIF